MKKEAIKPNEHTYRVTGVCRNCGGSQIEQIPTGTTIEEAFNRTRCKKCGCKTLKREMVW